MPKWSTLSQKNTLASSIVFILHAVGIAGTLWMPTRALTLSLTSINLLLTALLIVYSHPGTLKTLMKFLAITFIIGYGVEVLGVHTGFPFGSYVYGETLGWKVLQVPLIIGVNWFLLSYTFGMLVKPLKNAYLQVLLAAVGMVALDVLIEHVAMRLDYWSWEGGQIPWSNYLGWLAVSLVVQLIFVKLRFSTANTLSWPVFIAQLLYFAFVFIFVRF